MTFTFRTAAGGDLRGTYPNPAVATVGGASAATIADGASAAYAATSANTVSTIVKRDPSGNFSAGTITLADNLALPATASTRTGTPAGVVAPLMPAMKVRVWKVPPMRMVPFSAATPSLQIFGRMFSSNGLSGRFAKAVSVTSVRPGGEAAVGALSPEVDGRLV